LKGVLQRKKKPRLPCKRKSQSRIIYPQKQIVGCEGDFDILKQRALLLNIQQFQLNNVVGKPKRPQGDIGNWLINLPNLDMENKLHRQVFMVFSSTLWQWQPLNYSRITQDLQLPILPFGLVAYKIRQRLIMK